MFTINQSSSPRKAASALAVLAAIGSSGMVAQVAAAAVEIEPSVGARSTSSSYMGTSTPANWRNWLTDTSVTYHAPPNGPAFTTWPVNFGDGPITSAKYRIDANGNSHAFGIPAGSTLSFALITEPWSPATPDSNQLGPDHGSTLGVDLVQVISPGTDFDADITPLFATWQANPTAYYGVRFSISGELERGGVWAPNETADAPGITANLILEQSPIPEPASAGLLALGSALLMRRGKRSAGDAEA